nr:SBBP repeat-containing protein [uncultured Rhodoferax sp.]
MDNIGNVYVVDGGAIRKVSPVGAVTTLLAINSPRGIAVDSTGTLYISSGNSVLKVTNNGVVTTLAGNDSAGFADGLGGAALFNIPLGVAVDYSGNVYVVDAANQAIRKISPQGQVTTLARGNLVNPQDLTVDGSGNVYVTGDRPTLTGGARATPIGGGSVHKVSRDGVVTLVAGDRWAGYVNGVGTTEHFYWPIGIAVDGAGNLYVGDFFSNAIRKITP